MTHSKKGFTNPLRSVKKSVITCGYWLIVMQFISEDRLRENKYEKLRISEQKQTNETKQIKRILKT